MAAQRRATTSWIGWLFEWWPTQSRYVLPATFIAVLVFGIGLLIAVAGGFALRYLTTPQIAALTVVTGWVFGWGAWSTGALRALPPAIRPALRRPEDESYRALSERWYRSVFSTWPNFVLGAGWLCLVVWPLWLQSVWLEWVPSAWDDADDLRFEQVILTFYFAIGSPLFITMLWGFCHYVYFTRRALKYPLALTPNLARTCLRPITVFGLWTGFAWSVAVTLGVVFFARDVSYLIAAFLIALGVMGVSLIILPQLLAHSALTAARDELVVETANALRAEEPAQWVERYVINANPRTQQARTFLGELQNTPVWIYSPAEALTLVAEVLLPIALFVLTQS